MLVVVLIIGSSGSSELSLLENAMSTTFSREDAIIIRSPFMILNIGSAGSSEPSLLANATSIALSYDVSIIFQVALP